MSGIPWLHDEGDGDWRIAKIDRFEAEGGPYAKPAAFRRADVGEDVYCSLTDTIDPGDDDQ